MALIEVVPSGPSKLSANPLMEGISDVSSSPSPERSPPTEEQVRRALTGFSDLIRQLEAEGRLAREVPTVMRYLGELRQMLFDYEVRVTERLLPTDDPQERRSRWIVREAKDRSEDSEDDWGPGANPPVSE